MKPFLIALAILLTLAACASEGQPVDEPEPAADSGGALSPVAAETPETAAPAAPETAVAPTNEPGVESDVAASEPVSPVVVDLGELTPLPPENNEPVEMPQPGSPGDPLAKLMRLVTNDLANRRSVDISHITLVGYEEVTWPNSGLGCPEADMAYLSVLTPGYKITLSFDGAEYTYHTNQDERFVLCANGKPVLDERP